MRKIIAGVDLSEADVIAIYANDGNMDLLRRFSETLYRVGSEYYLYCTGNSWSQYSKETRFGHRVGTWELKHLSKEKVATWYEGRFHEVWRDSVWVNGMAV